MLFDLHTSSRGGWVVVAVVGDLDMTSAPTLRSEVVRLVAAGETLVVLDLSGVTFCDSVGLGVLVGAKKRLRSRSGELRLADCSEAVWRVLRLTDLDRAMPPYDDVERALHDPVATVGAV